MQYKYKLYTFTTYVEYNNMYLLLNNYYILIRSIYKFTYMRTTVIAIFIRINLELIHSLLS